MQEPNNSNSNPKDISRFESIINDLKRRFPINHKHDLTKPKSNNQTLLIASISQQRLYLFKDLMFIKSYLISSAKAGSGNLSGSYQTPLGIHRIAEKVGSNAPYASIFKGRKDTQTIAEIFNNPNIRSKDDNITSRILWLDGLEESINKGLDKENNNVDSFSRYIYIHGTDEEWLLGQTVSHGCLRMNNHDVIELFEKTKIDDLIIILED